MWFWTFLWWAWWSSHVSKDFKVWLRVCSAMVGRSVRERKGRSNSEGLTSLWTFLNFTRLLYISTSTCNFFPFLWALRLVYLHYCLELTTNLEIYDKLKPRLNDQTFLSNVEFVCDGWTIFGENVWCRSNTESHPMLRDARLNGKAYVLPTRCRTKGFGRLTWFVSLISLSLYA